MYVFKDIKTTFTRNVTVPGLLVLLVLSLACALFPERMNEALNAVQSVIYTKLSWTYILIVSFFVVFLFTLAFSKIGTIRLGADNSSPQYSFFSWIAMLFAAGMGIGLMYFGVAEPMSHYVNPALPGTLQPAKDAQLATFFHWGLHAWAIFAVAGLILAYFSFRYKLPLAIRSGLYPILKDRINGPIGDVVDIFALVSTFFGIATSLGFGVVQLNAGLVHLGIFSESSYLFQCIIITVVSAVAIFSAVAGVNKGVKKLSEINLGLAVLLMIFVLLLGPTTFLMSAFSEGVGNYIGRLPSLTFNTFAFESDSREWFTSWTVMYWAWWISWAPFVGLFIARISKGRTIREYILAVLFVPSVFIFLWMTVCGNGAIYIDQHTANGALSALAGNPDVLLFTFFEQFPLAKPLCVLAVMMIAVFFVTSADSGILVMNSIASGNRPNAPKWQNAFWGVLLAVIAMALLRTGGLKSLQTMTLISALPFGLIMLLLCFCLLKALRTDRLYHSSRIPYGSRNWDGSHWHERLDQILTFSKRQDVKRFFAEKVRPAFEELRRELSERGIDAQIHQGKRGPLSLELLIPHDQIWNFRYGVAAEVQTISNYLIDDDNTPEIDDKKQYLPVTYFSDGRTGNDIQYLTKQEIIADVLREYERYISLVADENKAIMFVDKGNLN
ncbi:BCCT family transporter [Prevotella sp. HUN102]|uniref:BCCT family transporter n=1 Tax=Prevotella sp. HUN102 TaxID=1392486 RepID=UPI00048D8551|nr:BCCT family transporter [Prevotella sp. HUN102]